MSLYQEMILEHYRYPRNKGRLVHTDKTVSVQNPLCGDEITMDISFSGDKIDKIAFEGKGCAISQALSSMLTEYAKQKTKNKLRKLNKQFMIGLLGMELGPNRLKCALLPLEALQKLL